MDSQLDQVIGFLKENDLHLTRPRLSIAASLSALPGHHTIEELYDVLRETAPGIGKATVYRTVKLLQEAGLAQEIPIKDGPSRFETSTNRKRHDHLVCRNCGAVVEIDGQSLETMQTRLARQHGFTLDDRTRCLYGLCPACSAGEKR